MSLPGRPTRYVLPDVKPIFLGAIFTRVGHPGAIKPIAMYLELARIFERISSKLMPTLLEFGLALPQQRYHEIRAAIWSGADQAPNGLPQGVDGVAAYIIDYHTLQHMAQAASVPVPFLQPHQMWRFNGAALEEYRENLEQNLQSQPPAHMRQPLSHAEQERQVAKVRKICRQFEHLVQIVIDLPYPI